MEDLQFFHKLLALTRGLDGKPAFGGHGEWAARGRLQIRAGRTSSTLQLMADG